MLKQTNMEKDARPFDKTCQCPFPLLCQAVFILELRKWLSWLVKWPASLKMWVWVPQYPWKSMAWYCVPTISTAGPDQKVSGAHWPTCGASHGALGSMRDLVSKNKVVSNWKKKTCNIILLILHMYANAWTHKHTHTQEKENTYLSNKWLCTLCSCWEIPLEIEPSRKLVPGKILRWPMDSHPGLVASDSANKEGWGRRGRAQGWGGAALPVATQPEY